MQDRYDYFIEFRELSGGPYPVGPHQCYTHYTAPAPLPPRLSLIQKLLFPISMIIKSIQWLGSRLLGRLISFLVFPAQFNNNPDIDERDPSPEERKKYKLHIQMESREKRNAWVADCRAKTNTVNIELARVTTHDGAMLDTVEISPKKTQAEIEAQHDKNSTIRPHIIRFGGNTARYEMLFTEAVEDVIEHPCNIILFNSRGVGLSTGKPYSQRDLVADGAAQVQRLLDRGVAPEKIILDGHSLGGAIAILVAKHFYDRGAHVTVFSDRSFSSITNVVVGWIRGVGYNNGYRTSLLGRVLGWMSYPLLKGALVLAGWDLSVTRAFKALPNDCKAHLVLRSPKAEKGNPAKRTRPDDGVIRHWASLHAALKGERRREKRPLGRMASQAAQIRQRSHQHKAAVDEAGSAAQEIKRYPEHEQEMLLSYVGHQLFRKELMMRCAPGGQEAKGYTANHFFWHFVERSGNANKHDAASRPSENNRRKVA